MVVRASISCLLLLLGILITAMTLILPNVNAYTIQCEFEDWQGQKQICQDRSIENNIWPYKVEEYTNYYQITTDGDSCRLPKKSYISYDFTKNKISPTIIIPSLQKLADVTIQHNASIYYVPITNVSSNLKKCGKLIWDEQYTIRDAGQIDYPELEYFPTNKGTFKVINNQLRFYGEKNWFLNAYYPLIWTFDSWVVNKSGGWPGDFVQVSTDIDENLTIDWDNSQSEPYTTFYTMDNYSATTIFDENNTNNNDCTRFNTQVGVPGQRNVSANFTGATNSHLNCGNGAILRDFESITFSQWIYSRENGKEQQVVSMGKPSSSSLYGYTLNKRSSTNRYRCLFNNGSGSGVLSAQQSGTLLDLNKWYHITCRYDSTTDKATIFVNGNEQIYDSGVKDLGIVAVPNSRSLIISGWSAAPTQRNFNGRVDEVKIWINRSLSNAEVLADFNASFYSSGNFTTDERDAGAGNIAVNVTVQGTFDESSSMNIYINGSNDAWATSNMISVQTTASFNTNYSIPTAYRYYRVILELINGSTPHVSEIEVAEGADTVPPNITSMTPVNGSTFEQLGTEVNIAFGATCTDNVACDNATLRVWNSTSDAVDVFVVHTTKAFTEINGTIDNPGNADVEDGVYATFNEISGGTVDCLTAIVNFTSVPTDHDHTILLNHRYTGGASHTMFFWWYNFSNSEWVNFHTLAKTVQDQSFESDNIPPADSVSNGNFSILINHSDDSTCVSGHDYLLDLLELKGNNDIFSFTDGVANRTVALTVDGSPYLHSWYANDTSNNAQEGPTFGNYTFTITTRVPDNIIIIQPFNINYTSINIIPIRVQSNETEIQMWWYSINDTTNITFTPNTSTSTLPNGENFNITVCVNLTNTQENCTTRYFGIDYDGLLFESVQETRTGEGMILQMYLLLFSIGIGLMLLSMLRETGLMTPLVSSIFLFVTAFYSFDIENTQWTVTYEYVYEPLGLLCGLLGLLMMGMTLWKSTQEIPSEPGT